MSHSLLCVYRIPLIALLALLVLWLALSTSRSHAAAAAWQAPHRQAQVSATASYTATLKPASQAMLEHFFGSEIEQLNQVTGAAAPAGDAGATILVTKTVGTSPYGCATTGAIVVRPSTNVVYCYLVMNTSNITLNYQTVIDDKLGVLFEHVDYPLLPFGTLDAGAFFTVPVTVTEDVINVVEWSAETSEGQTVAQATDTAQVAVPAIRLKATINTGSTKCGTESTIAVLPNTPVIYCYMVENIGSVTLPTQTLVDSLFGVLLDQSPDPLPPGGKRTLKYTTVATQTVTSVVTWTGQTAEGLTTTAVSTLAVHIPSISLRATVGPQGNACAETKAITVTINTPVTLCYVVTNTGGFTLDQQLVSDMLYTYPPLTFPLEPAESFGVTITLPVTRTVVNTATWQARGPNGLLAIAQDTVNINISANTAIEVFVYYDVDGRGSWDTLEPGLPNVGLTIRSPSNRLYRATTDATGIARLTGLPEAGRFTVTIDGSTLPAHYEATSTALDINVASGRTAMQRYGFVAPEGTDTDQDLIPDRKETANDFDNDGIPNYLDDDSDGDGLLDIDEGLLFFLNPANGPIYLPHVGR